MYDTLKAICTEQGYVFTYGRRDFQNLYDEVETADPHVFLDPVVIDTTYNDYDNEDTKRFTGSFLVLVSSDHDVVDYDEKYQNYIKPLLAGAVATIREELNINDWVSFNTWRTTEVINIFDYGFDGVIVNFDITQDVARAGGNCALL